MEWGGGGGGVNPSIIYFRKTHREMRKVTCGTRSYISNVIGCCFAGAFTCEKIDSSYQLSNHEEVSDPNNRHRSYNVSSSHLFPTAADPEGIRLSSNPPPRP